MWENSVSNSFSVRKFFSTQLALRTNTRYSLTFMCGEWYYSIRENLQYLLWNWRKCNTKMLFICNKHKSQGLFHLHYFVHNTLAFLIQPYAYIQYPQSFVYHVDISCFCYKYKHCIQSVTYLHQTKTMFLLCFC